jgi:hypothetical protein
MGLSKQAPLIGVGHIVLETNQMEATARFMRKIGMCPVFDGPDVSVYEMRGGTHLLLMRRDHISPGVAPFDLMVDDLHKTHGHFTSLGLNPSTIESRPAIDHEIFTLREPAGYLFTVFSSHASGTPV